MMKKNSTCVILMWQTFAFSVEHQAPLIGFCGDRCVTLFPHTLIDELHDVFYEPKVVILLLEHSYFYILINDSISKFEQSWEHFHLYSIS